MTHKSGISGVCHSWYRMPSLPQKTNDAQTPAFKTSSSLRSANWKKNTHGLTWVSSAETNKSSVYAEINGSSTFPTLWGSFCLAPATRLKSTKNLRNLRPTGKYLWSLANETSFNSCKGRSPGAVTIRLHEYVGDGHHTFSPKNVVRELGVWLHWG